MFKRSIEVLAVLVSLALAALILGYCTPARADAGDTWGVVTCCSKHTKGEHNEGAKNWGLGAEHELTDRLRLAAGWFRNSNRIDSTYLLAAHCTVMWRYDWGRACVGPAGGMISGYAIDLQPVVFPVLGVEINRSIGFNTSVFKEFKSDTWVMGLQLKTTGRWEPMK